MPSKAAPCAVPPKAGPQDSALPDIRPTGSPDSETLEFHDLDVTMAESTFTFGNTVHMDDLGEGAVTPPPCAAIVTLTAELAQAIEDELRASSGNIAEPEMGDYRLVTRSLARTKIRKPSWRFDL